MAITRLVTLRIRLRTFRFRPPTWYSIFSWSALAPECHHSATRYRWDSECCSPPPSCPRASSALGLHPAPGPSPRFGCVARRWSPAQSLVPGEPASWHPALLHAHPAKTAIHHIRSHLPFQRFITPVAHVFQDQHAQGHFCRGLLTPSHLALRMSLALGVVHGIH
jgi:hypothetical protein